MINYMVFLCQKYMSATMKLYDTAFTSDFPT